MSVDDGNEREGVDIAVSLLFEISILRRKYAEEEKKKIEVLFELDKWQVVEKTCRLRQSEIRRRRRRRRRKLGG